jgi:putative DNA primase/helicase
MTDKGSTSLDAQRDVRAKPSKHTHASLTRAQALWDSAQPIVGTKAETYLRAHGIVFCPAELRYLAYCPVGTAAHPAMLAAVRDADGLVAVEQTLLRSDGLALADVAQPKHMLGVPGGGLGRWGAAPVKVLRLAEDAIEAASAMIVGTHGIPVWPVFGIERYGVIDIPPSIEQIIIYTGPGAGVAQAIGNAALHLAAGGRAIDVIIPPGDASWNAYLRRIEGMRNIDAQPRTL